MASALTCSLASRTDTFSLINYTIKKSLLMTLMSTRRDSISGNKDLIAVAPATRTRARLERWVAASG